MSGAKSPSRPGNPGKTGGSGNKKPKPTIQVNPTQFKARIQNEVNYFQLNESDLVSYKLISVEKENRLWTVLFMPNNPPYNAGAFRMIVELPNEFPYKPPQMHFVTRIYHPNVDEQGKVDVPICSNEFWKPAIRMPNVCDAVIDLLDRPNPHHALRKDVGEQMLKDREKFVKIAADAVKNHSELRT
uniref:UBC core domain-containing protein n=1 Tax=Panagrolaimus sp. JU765 TaxID=591449 RepID=A0AC34QXI1_9BILA